MSKKCLTSLIAGLLLSTTVQSATVYVSDIQFVAIREGLDNNTRAVERGLKSGTPLDVLEQSEGYTKVKTPSGNEGWVADYFLSEDMVTRDQLDNLQTRLNRSIESRDEIANTLNVSQQKIQTLNRTNTSLQDENESLKQQLQDAVNLTQKAQAIVSQNDDVSYQLASLKQQADAAVARSEKLQNSTEQKWFMLGAATIFGGLLLGLLLPMLRRRKNSAGSWS
ncbi:TIGR04211 family SH3 domain-containing protein [Marinomonas sp. M1K-6]|uniref:TIGR04211 family SH3 domain-containing protein n=1 Tax=Marinomonas profundi TaxID=2726122 RepID=A0A847R9H8_9GAMM|nr:TIGR04211 family SH3 domain-containing protein [Marinomonas profundi]NLQ19103.1 TIGR04211 family SH3 domain-containing protein [Marinomonas profundi]UDV02936.1 TIGR04211 family SH3 domain-containing protein [Marinomonas profundi]